MNNTPSIARTVYYRHPCGGPMRLCAWLRRRKRLRFPYGIPRIRYWDENWNEIGGDR